MKKFNVVIFFVLALVTTIVVSFAYRYYSAPIQGAVEQQEILYKGTNKIAKYDWFYDTCASAKALQENIQVQNELLGQVSDSEKTRVLTNIAGQKSQLNRIINDYNASSNKAGTSAKFKSNSLPYKLSADQIQECQ